MQGNRSTQIHSTLLHGPEGAAGSRLGQEVGGRALSGENPRYGYCRVWALLLKREGWPLNAKRVYRLWREEGLKVPAKQPKRRRLVEGPSANWCTSKRAERKDHL
jgi:transposase InsO family protein